MTKNVPSIKSKDIAKSKRQINPEDAIDYELPKGLTKGKYDIDFAIGICDMVMQHCEQHKFSSSLYISLNHSLSKLKTMLQQEKQPKNSNPVILFTCSKCKESQLILASQEKEHECKLCFVNGQPKQIEYLPD